MKRIAAVLICMMCLSVLSQAFFPQEKVSAAQEEDESVLEQIARTVEQEISLTRCGCTQDPETVKLWERTRDLTACFEGDWSVYCERVDTRERFCIGSQPMVAASLIKLYVYGAVREQIEKENLDDDEIMEELLWNMIAYSDNDAWYILTDMAGKDAIRRFIARQGFTDTGICRLSPTYDLENFTTVRDCGRLLEKVLNRTYGSVETSGALLDALKNQYYREKIPSGVPADVVTANKTGELDEMEHDAAIIYAPDGTYILVVMTCGADPTQVYEQYRILSEMIYSLI